MSDNATARLAMPLLQPEQAQKEMFHNEALAALDIVVQAVVEAIGIDSPPAAEAGQCWIVGDAPVGAWAGHAGAIASYSAGGWRFAAPLTGMQAWSRADACAARFDGTTWRIGEVRARSVLVEGIQVIGAQQPAVNDPAGGTIVDAEARGGVSAILQILRNHGLIVD